MKENLIKTEMNVNNEKISVMRIGNEEYISLTDLAKYANPTDPSGVIRNWMSNKNSFEFYSLWEELNNENFNSVESHRIKIEKVGYNRFTMTPSRWKKDFNAIGIIPSSGKYSAGTFAHSDIALEFASWLSPEFKLYLIKEFERLKRNEAYQEKIDWNASRILSKANYKIHTDAIKKSIVPNLVTDNQKKHAYSTEADLLNVALFGITAKEWHESNPDLSGNIRDYTDILHLVVLANLENLNAEMITTGISQSERLVKLNKTAQRQLKLLKDNSSIKKLENMNEQLKFK